MYATEMLVEPVTASIDADDDTLTPSGRNRRLFERLTPGELSWLTAVRLQGVPRVSLVDISATGAQIESPAPLRPGAQTLLTIVGRYREETVKLRVLRCEIASLSRGLVYRGAGTIDKALDLATGWVSPAAGSRAGEKRTPPVSPRPAVAAPVGIGWTKLVVRYMDGGVLKGFSQDFHPSRAHFHLSTVLGEVNSAPALIPTEQLKAVFFVRDFEGNAAYVKRKGFVAPVQGRRVEVTFLDGEILLGATLGYRPDGAGFFVTPADPNGNNLRIFVLRAAVRHIRYI